MNHQEIKAFVINTIRTGSKKRIQQVLTRYQEWLKKEREKEFIKTAAVVKESLTARDAYLKAKDIFDESQKVI